MLRWLPILALACTGMPAAPADSGVAPDSGSVSDGGSVPDSGQADAGSNPWPVVPRGDGGFIAQPNLVLLTYSDFDAGALEQFAVWITDGGFLPRVAAEYGVGNGSTQHVMLGDSSTAPAWHTSADQNIFGPYVTGLIAAGTLPANAPGNIYAVELPYSWPSRAAYCAAEHSFHSLEGNVIYLVVADCGPDLEQIEVATSHELVEAATDPRTGSWQIVDPGNPWTYLGGEVGDLCASFTAPYREGPWAAQLMWSNAAAARGDVPCQPWPMGAPYITLTSALSMASAAAGSSVDVPVSVWTTASSGTWSLYATETGYQTSFLTMPTLSVQTIGVGGSATVTLHVPSSAQPGQHGAAWIVLYDAATRDVFGSTMVGVTVE